MEDEGWRDESQCFVGLSFSFLSRFDLTFAGGGGWKGIWEAQ